MKQILLTGGSGLVGSHLTTLLRRKGHGVAHLSSSHRTGVIPAFTYDPYGARLPDDAREALLRSDVVVHLAGEPIAAKRWNSEQKKRIVDSRVCSTELLCNTILEAKKSGKKAPTRYIQASAIGYYGDRGNTWLSEDSTAGEGFLADTVRSWELASAPLDGQVSKAIVRIGIVLDRMNGALPKMAGPIRLFAGVIPGTGKQIMSWIHVDDLAALFAYLTLQDSLQGVFNAVAPEPVSEETLLKEIARILHRPSLMPHIPDFVLRLAMGEMAELVLSSALVSNRRIAEESGFVFRFQTVSEALTDLLR